jgi:hypothetical protein
LARWLHDFSASAQCALGDRSNLNPDKHLVRSAAAPDIFQSDRSSEIPIAAPPTCQISRGFLPWRLSHDGPGVRLHSKHGAVIRNPSQQRKWACIYDNPKPLIAPARSRAAFRNRFVLPIGQMVRSTVPVDESCAHLAMAIGHDVPTAVLRLDEAKFPGGGSVAKNLRVIGGIYSV